jgi:hypothetical protein
MMFIKKILPLSKVKYKRENNLTTQVSSLPEAFRY